MSDPSGDVVVVGASISGLTAAIALARRGVGVHLVDADGTVGRPAGGEIDPLGELARRAPRRATPQAGHSHAFLARCRDLLRSEAPDVLHGLRAAGCAELVLAERRPPTVPGHAAHPDDADLVVVAARRTTFEAVLRKAALRRPEIRLSTGRRATGLVVDGDGSVPRVRGVGFDDRSVAEARLVVDATGRRTAMPGWLAAEGVELSDHRVDCGISYLTRFYRREFGAPELPLERGFTAGGSFDRYSCLVFPGDAGTFSVTFGILPEDRGLRGLLDGEAFDLAVRTIPVLAPWIDPAHAEPLSDVRMMAGLANRLRVAVRRGRPSVLGWVAVGDAAATTNPAHSRGCTLGPVHAVGVAAAVAEHRDPGTLAEACAAVVERDQRPWVADSIEQDRQRLARWRPDGPSPAALPEPDTEPDRDPLDPTSAGPSGAARAGIGAGPFPADPAGPGPSTFDPAPAGGTVAGPFPAGGADPLLAGPEPVPPAVGAGPPSGARPAGMARLTNGETYLAAQHDAYVWRRFSRLQQLFERPDDVLADPRVVARVRAVQASRPPSPALDGPSRDELVDLLAAHEAVA